MTHQYKKLPVTMKMWMQFYVMPWTNRITATVRSNDSNSKAQLERHLAAFNWSELYNMTSTESIMTTYFFLTSRRRCLNTTFHYDQSYPWITDGFRRLIRQCQSAWRHHNTAEYKRHRNAVNRLCRDNCESVFTREKQRAVQ